MKGGKKTNYTKPSEQ
uniref:Uncharacterized protein n=1 Tax=Arundo donax TaxID=35708 RepID=A0A0A9ADB9_ARUDO